ncbi:MAG: RNA polymerase sigma factor [Candidatus Aminicenantes bacterium]|nr:RNA polymerase sigma factor [Candidatus Aminicenantes bacterium]
MEEKELVIKSQKGDQEAFSVLVENYKRKVFNLALSMTHNPEVSDDMAQEVFIKAYYGLPKFKLHSQLGTWLYQITVNTVRDFLRKEARTKKVTFTEKVENTAAIEDEFLKREEMDEKERRKKLLRRVIGTLPEKYRIILSLRDIQGLSYETITKILNISPGTVDSRLHRARKLLRKKMLPHMVREGVIS